MHIKASRQVKPSMASEGSLMNLGRVTHVMHFTLGDQLAIGRDCTDDLFMLRGRIGARLRQASKAVVVA